MIPRGSVATHIISWTPDTWCNFFSAKPHCFNYWPWLLHLSTRFHLQFKVTEFPFCMFKETHTPSLISETLNLQQDPLLSHDILLLLLLEEDCCSSVWFCQGLSSLMLRGDVIQGDHGRVWSSKLQGANTLPAGGAFIGDTQRPSCTANQQNT